MLLDGAAGVVFAVATLLVLLSPFGVVGAQVMHVHSTVISTRIDNNFFNVFT